MAVVFASVSSAVARGYRRRIYAVTRSNSLSFPHLSLPKLLTNTTVAPARTSAGIRRWERMPSNRLPSKMTNGNSVEKQISWIFEKRSSGQKSVGFFRARPLQIFLGTTSKRSDGSYLSASRSCRRFSTGVGPGRGRTGYRSHRTTRVEYSLKNTIKRGSTGGPRLHQAIREK